MESPATTTKHDDDGDSDDYSSDDQEDQGDEPQENDPDDAAGPSLDRSTPGGHSRPELERPKRKGKEPIRGTSNRINKTSKYRKENEVEINRDELKLSRYGDESKYWVKGHVIGAHQKEGWKKGFLKSGSDRYSLASGVGDCIVFAIFGRRKNDQTPVAFYGHLSSVWYSNKTVQKRLEKFEAGVNVKRRILVTHSPNSNDDLARDLVSGLRAAELYNTRLGNRAKLNYIPYIIDFQICNIFIAEDSLVGNESGYKLAESVDGYPFFAKIENQNSSTDDKGRRVLRKLSSLVKMLKPQWP
jgi:hypothetical protein